MRIYQTVLATIAVLALLALVAATTRIAFVIAKW
jgi:hypothetical protein